jgi:VanZ like family
MHRICYLQDSVDLRDFERVHHRTFDLSTRFAPAGQIKGNCVLTDRPLSRNAAIVLTIGFLYGSLVPLTFRVPAFGPRLTEMITVRQWARIQPFDTVVNFAAFIPMGFLWAAVSSSRTSRRLDQRSLRVLDKSQISALVICFAIALIAECLQFFVPVRTPSLPDVVALESGAVVGCLAWSWSGGRINLVMMALRRFTSFTANGRLLKTLAIPLPALVFAGCLMLQFCVSPAECFLIYRSREINFNGVVAGRELSWLTAVGSSAVAALLAAVIGRVTGRTPAFEKGIGSTSARRDSGEVVAVRLNLPASKKAAPVSKRAA